MKHYAVRYTQRGSYTLLGRPCIVRTFVTEADRELWLAEERPVTSVLHDGRREAVVPWTTVTDKRSGRQETVVEAVPGI